MIKASSLFYAIVISLLIAIVSSSLILFSYLSTIQFDNFKMSERLKLNVDSGINLLLAKQNIVELNQEKKIDLYGTGEDEVFLSRKTWGAYEVIISKAAFKNDLVLKIAQIGYAIDSSKNYSLYLKDEDKPLAVCGKTKIRGTTYLPKAGVKRAYIEGQNFTGDKLIDGLIKQSKKTLPEFNKELNSVIESYISKKAISEKDSLVFIERDIVGDTLENSFLNKTVVFDSENAIKISNSFLKGNLIVTSAKQITISKDASLNNIILIAPKIIFEKEFKGNLQAFSTDSIIVKENVNLKYPSCIGIIKSNSVLPVSAIIFTENDSLYGNVFAFKNSMDPMKQVGVILKKNSCVYGTVFSNGYADVQGIINGSLMCSKIMLSTPSSVYENHLLNAEIDVTKLSKYYVGINCVEVSEKKKIVKWLE